MKKGDKLYCYNNDNLNYFIVGKNYDVKDVGFGPVIGECFYLENENKNDIIFVLDNGLKPYTKWFKSQLDLRKEKIDKIISKHGNK